MALKINTLKEEKMAGWEANRDLFLDEKGKAVELGDPASRFLLVRKGRKLTDEQIKRHGVKKAKPKGGKK